MRLVTLRTPAGLRAAAVVDVAGVDRVVELAGSVTDVLADPGARSAAETAVSAATDAAPAVADVELDAPVRPGKLLCLGYNYRGHVPDGVDRRHPIRSSPTSSSRRRTRSADRTIRSSFRMPRPMSTTRARSPS